MAEVQNSEWAAAYQNDLDFMAEDDWGLFPFENAFFPLDDVSRQPEALANVSYDMPAEPPTHFAPRNITNRLVPGSNIATRPIARPASAQPGNMLHSQSVNELPAFSSMPEGRSPSGNGLTGNAAHSSSVTEILSKPPTKNGNVGSPRRRRRCDKRAGGSSQRFSGRFRAQNLQANHGSSHLKKLDRKPSRDIRESSAARSLRLNLHERYSVTFRNCCLWIQTYGREPSTRDLRYLSDSNEVSTDLIQELIKSISRDSGYQTRSTEDSEITRKYESKQSIRIRGRNGGLHSSVKNPERPFVCTHRCGLDFDRKAAWEKHELIHYPQDVWVCRESCHNQPNEKQVWLRKDHFRKHLSKYHAVQKVTEQLYSTSRLPVASRYPRACHIPGCDGRFNSWDDRMRHMAAHMKEEYDTSTWGNLEDEVTSHGIEERAHNFDDSDLESSDLDSGIDDDDDLDDPDDNQGGPGDGGSGFSSRPGPSEGPSGRGARWPPSSSGQQRQSGTGNEGPFESNSQWRGHTSDKLHLLTGLAKSNGMVHIRSSLQSPPHEDREPDTNSLEHDFEDLITLGSRWTLSDFQLSSVRWLGSGATARVDEVRTPGARETMARKVVECRYPAARQSINREADIMHRLQHSHIVRLLTAFKDTSTITLFMKPAADYSLAYYMQARSSVAPAGNETWKWFSCLVSGLHYMHAQGILHGDIKPDNILVFNNHIIYTDFGLSNTIPDDASMISDAGFITKQYAAPEVKRGKRGKPSDIWSLGCVFLELATVTLHRSIAHFYDARKLPRAKKSGDTMDFSYSENMVAVAKWIKELRRVSYTEQAPQAVLTGLESCQIMMNTEPKRRLTAIQLSSRMPPRDCCIAFERARPHRDKPREGRSLIGRDRVNSIAMDGGDQDCALRSKVSMAMVPMQKLERNSHSQPMGPVARRISPAFHCDLLLPRSSTLSYWLGKPNSYKTLVTGCVGMFKIRRKNIVRDLLKSLNCQIDSQRLMGALMEQSPLASHQLKVMVHLSLNQCSSATNLSSVLMPVTLLIEDVSKDCISKIPIISGADIGTVSDVKKGQRPSPATDKPRTNTDKAGGEESLSQAQSDAAVGKSFNKVDKDLRPTDNEVLRVAKRSRVYQTVKETQVDRSTEALQLKKSRFRLTGRVTPALQHRIDGWELEAYQYRQSLQTAIGHMGDNGVSRSNQANDRLEQGQASVQPRQPLSGCRAWARERVGCQRRPNCQASCLWQGAW